MNFTVFSFLEFFLGFGLRFYFGWVPPLPFGLGIFFFVWGFVCVCVLVFFFVVFCRELCLEAAALIYCDPCDFCLNFILAMKSRLSWNSCSFAEAFPASCNQVDISAKYFKCLERFSVAKLVVQISRLYFALVPYGTVNCTGRFSSSLVVNWYRHDRSGFFLTFLTLHTHGKTLITSCQPLLTFTM